VQPEYQKFLENMELKNEEVEQVTTFTDSVVFEIIKEFGDRAKKGYDKYGTDMDRTDLSVSEWAQHLREELMDALVYLTRLKKDVIKLEEELAAFKNDTKAENEVKFYDGAEFVTYKYVTQPSKKAFKE
jgi:hypothetical protein